MNDRRKARQRVNENRSLWQQTGPLSVTRLRGRAKAVLYSDRIESRSFVPSDWCCGIIQDRFPVQ